MINISIYTRIWKTTLSLFCIRPLFYIFLCIYVSSYSFASEFNRIEFKSVGLTFQVPSESRWGSRLSAWGRDIEQSHAELISSLPKDAGPEKKGRFSDEEMMNFTQRFARYALTPYFAELINVDISNGYSKIIVTFRHIPDQLTSGITSRNLLTALLEAYSDHIYRNFQSTSDVLERKKIFDNAVCAEVSFLRHFNLEPKRAEGIACVMTRGRYAINIFSYWPAVERKKVLSEINQILDTIKVEM